MLDTAYLLGKRSRDLADRSSKHALEDGRVRLATKKDILRDELL
jgi:hypothetical protein